jgi:hypothetical protein|tara:strand:- start:226 stop:399 length:174 start_codon:yes stop_codon:yes gene_type:complete
LLPYLVRLFICEVLIEVREQEINMLKALVGKFVEFVIFHLLSFVGWGYALMGATIAR